MSIINNALTGSLAAQIALNTASQNIANLQTAGYTRQGVLLASVGPTAGVKSAGNGVEVSSLLRFSDGYKNQALWRAAANQGALAQTQPYLTQLEQVMGDEQSGISSGIDEFFAALNAAAVDPTSTPLRQQVVTAASSMAQHFNSVYSVTTNQIQSMNQQRAAMVPQINTAVASIAQYNKLITAANSSGTNISALLDARDQAIDGLSSLMALEVVNQPDGSATVSLKSGQPLVIGSLAGSFTATVDANNEQTLHLSFATETFDVEAAGVGGQLGGLAAYQKNTLEPLRASIAGLAESLSQAVNDGLSNGSANGDGTTSGLPLFVFSAGSGTSLLTTTDGFKAEDLAFAAPNTAPGDTSNLLALIAIKNNPVTLASVGTVLIGDADTQLVGKLGIDSKQNQALLTTATTVRSQALTDWQSTSAVNKDEEAINLIEYQQMYSANMKVIQVANEIFDATLAMMN